MRSTAQRPHPRTQSSEFWILLKQLAWSYWSCFSGQIKLRTCNSATVWIPPLESFHLSGHTWVVQGLDVFLVNQINLWQARDLYLIGFQTTTSHSAALSGLSFNLAAELCTIISLFSNAILWPNLSLFLQDCQKLKKWIMP